MSLVNFVTVQEFSFDPKSIEGNRVKALARIAIVACLGGLSFAGFWWLFGRLGSVFGFPGSVNVPSWIVGVSAALLAGCGEAWRVFIEYRVARKNREVADQIGCSITNHVSAAEIRSWPQVSLFRNDSPSGSNRMTGTHNGRQIDVFDFKYTVTSHSSGEGSSSSTSTYALSSGFRVVCEAPARRPDPPQ